MQKLLIISCTGGSGHIRAAEALKKTCDQDYRNIECRHFNIADYSGWLLKLSMVSSYNFLAKHSPQIFKKLYYFTDNPKGTASFSKAKPLLRVSSKKIIEAIQKYHPDRIICTHFLAPVLLEPLKLTCPIDIVVTDFYMHNIWNAPQARAIFVASVDTKKTAPQEAKNIVVSGIPVDPIFSTEKNNVLLKNKYHTNNEYPTVLVLSGGMGLVDPSSSVEHLLQNFSSLNVIAVTGKNNKTLYKKLSTLKKYVNPTNTYQVIDFTNDIDELMRIADVVVTKPGGLTISECLFLQKPLILTTPIPGQEEANTDYIIKNNFGCVAKNPTELQRHLTNLINNKHTLNPPPKTKPATHIILDYH